MQRSRSALVKRRKPRENTTVILTRTLTVTRTVRGLNQQAVTLCAYASLHSKLEALGDRVGQPQEENKKLRKEIGERRQREADMKGLVDEANMKGLVDEANMKGLVDEANFYARLAGQRSDRNEHYSRLWDLKLLFIPENTFVIFRKEILCRKPCALVKKKMGQLYIRVML